MLKNSRVFSVELQSFISNKAFDILHSNYRVCSHLNKGARPQKMKLILLVSDVARTLANLFNKLARALISSFDLKNALFGKF